MAVVNFQLKSGVVLHNALHRLIGGWVSGTDTLEAKLAQYIAGLSHKPLFQLFLDIRKTCDSLDRERCIEVLSGYGVGLNLARLLKSYWERQRIAPKTGKFLGDCFWTGRSLTQRYPA